MTIESDIQSLQPGQLVELYILDATSIGGGTSYFHPGTDAGTAKVVFQGNIYDPLPIDASGFEIVGTGQAPRPKVKVANINQIMGSLNRSLDDLVGAKVTRKRTFAKYLDGQPGADPTAEFPLDVYYIERKVLENKIYVEYELVGIYDMDGILLPKRLVIGGICSWLYRSSECSYVGGPVAKADDTPTSDPNLDKCGKRLSSCKLRFGALGLLPFGAFPGAGRV